MNSLIANKLEVKTSEREKRHRHFIMVARGNNIPYILLYR